MGCIALILKFQPQNLLPRHAYFSGLGSTEWFMCPWKCVARHHAGYCLTTPMRASALLFRDTVLPWLAPDRGLFT